MKYCHPLEDTPITVAYPWLEYLNISSCFKKKESQVEEPLLRDYKENQKDNEALPISNFVKKIPKS